MCSEISSKPNAESVPAEIYGYDSDSDLEEDWDDDDDEAYSLESGISDGILEDLTPSGSPIEATAYHEVRLPADKGKGKERVIDDFSSERQYNAIRIVDTAAKT
jgi:hypothetical protein